MADTTTRPGGSPPIGLFRNDPKTREGKFPVLFRRDGTIPEWPWFVLGARDPAAAAGLRAYADAFERHAAREYGAPSCPTCKGPVLRVERSAGSALNEHQFNSSKAGDWFCEKCPSNDRGGRSGLCYWWEHEAVYPDRVYGARKYVTDVRTLAESFERFRASLGNGDPEAGPHRKDDPLILAIARGEVTFADLASLVRTLADADRLGTESVALTEEAAARRSDDKAHLDLTARAMLSDADGYSRLEEAFRLVRKFRLYLEKPETAPAGKGG